MAAADRRSMLATIGWFLLGFAWLWLVSQLADALLSSLAGVTAALAGSVWARAAFLFGAALVATLVAVVVARRHRRWGAETLRAAWVVGAIDIALGVAALAGIRAGTSPAVPLAEGAGFLAAAALLTLFAPLPASRAVTR